MAKSETRGRLQTVENLFTILTTLRELDGARICELGSHTELANSTVHRHLSTLHDMGYVVKEGDVYHVGLGFLDLGEYARTRKLAYRLAKPKVEEIAEQTGERCQFVVEEHGHGVKTYMAAGDKAVEVDARVGKTLHLHSTAAGKAILAHLPDQRVAEILDEQGLPALTERTPTSREELYDELEQVQEEGVAYNREGNIEGLWSVGVPVFGADGRVVGSISISGPTHRMKGGRYTESLPDLLLGTANELELNLKYS